MIDKVPREFKRIGIDFNAHVIAALIGIRDMVDELPSQVSEEYYKEIKNSDPEPIKCWVRFVCSFGAKLDNGFARNKAGQNYAAVAVRNAQKQSPNLKGVTLLNDDYERCSKAKNCIIYCDPPYQGTTSYKTGAFDHDKFWEWCRVMSKDNLVFISEYNAPADFKCIWEGEIKTNFASQRKEATHSATEKLFKYKPL